MPGPHALADRHEAVVIGAGVAGIHQIKELTDRGIDAVVIESGADLGGTWFWNRYPGARFDSESYSYGYSWATEILETWHWKEHFSGQPENLRYLQTVADTYDLRRFMHFDCHVESLVWNDDATEWTVTLTDGRTIRTPIVITAIGLLTVPTPPRYPGVERFTGRSFHTHDWPAEPLDLSELRVAVIGTGATGIQVIGEIQDKVAELHVFQRRPNWSAPLNNAPISPAEMDEIRDRYDEIFEVCARTPGGFVHEPDRRGFWEVTEAERFELWDRLYDEPGFAIWLQNFVEIFIDEEANRIFSDYIAERIRQRVDDPTVAEKLIPTDHGFGYQRVPMETNYFEAYNRPNVHLVDVSETPIVEITETGIATTDAHREFDLIVYATGFDAITGAFDKIHVEGVDGVTLRDKWRDDPATFMGVMTHGFPNLLMVAGPQSGNASTNFPRGIETGVAWLTGLLDHARAHGITRIEATEEAERAWVDHVKQMYEMMLLRKAKGWFTGYNSNVEGHEEGTMRHLIYNGGSPKYQAKLDAITESGYEGVTLTGPRH